MEFQANCLVTGIGSLPHRDPREACQFVLRHVKDIPFWPQLPRRDSRESMYAQYTEGLPRVTVKGERAYIDASQDLSPELEGFYERYLSEDLNSFSISADYAAGLHVMGMQIHETASSEGPTAGTPHGAAIQGTGIDGTIKALKGQVTGPISFGLQVTTQDNRSIIYDPTLMDAAVKNLRMKAMWQEARLREIFPATIIFLDEPYMSAFGSAFFSLSREQVVNNIEEVVSGLRGLTGIHCCGNTDWSILMETSVGILSFDAYGYPGSLPLYAKAVKDFIRRGGILAWGVIPNTPEAVAGETPASLQSRLESVMALLTSKGISLDEILASSLITPSCGFGLADVETAEKAFTLAQEVSGRMRQKYNLAYNLE